jgi:hypothetical protein
MRPKRHDSVNRIIIGNGPQFQSLDAVSISPAAGCVIFAAFAASF